jgi:hypothetical protein
MKTATKIAVVPKQHYRSFMSIISNMSILELKQMLARVNQDIKSIKKAEKIAAEYVPTEFEICNNIAKSFTNKQFAKPVENAKLKADIQIQQDILEYLNNGNHIITKVSRKRIKPFVVSLSNQVSL